MPRTRTNSPVVGRSVERVEHVAPASTVLERAEAVKSAIWRPHAGPQTEALARYEEEILYGGARGGGKRVRLDTLVLTDSGWKRAGDIEAADLLVAVDGSYTKIKGIFRAEDRPTYRVTFSDGQVIFCDDEHNWYVYSQKHGKRDGWKIRTTEHLAVNPSNWVIPVLECAVPGKSWTGVDPYIIGYILGNGTLTGDHTTIYSDEQEVVDQLKVLGWKCYRYEYSTCWMLQTNDEKCRGLLGRVSGDNKFIPQELLLADADTRLLLLQGLMDSDGTCDKEGRASFSTTNDNLRDGVIYLARSLGGRASCHKVYKETDRGGRGWYYRINVSYGGKFNPFRLTRKSKRVRDNQRMDNISITSIERVENSDGVCFSVDHPSKLFVIDDFIVTHNTDAGQAWLTRWTHVPDLRALVLRRNADDLYDWIDRAQRMYAPLGAVVVGKPAEFRFPSGAKIRCGHLKDDDAFEKYQGHEYQKMVLEELTQIESEELYIKLLGSNRSTVPGLRAQVFCTTNPGGAGHCVPFGDVLTSTGWKSIADVKVGDLVATLGQNEEMIFFPVEQKCEHEYSGKILKFNSITGDITCTPEHKIVRRTETKSKSGRKYHAPSFIKAVNVSQVTRVIRSAKNWVGSPIDSFTVPCFLTRKTKLKQPLTVSGDDYCSLMGWFLSEGYVVDRDKAFGISQVKVINREKIIELLERIGFSFSEGASGFLVYSPSWWAYMRRFGKCRDKFIPDNIKNASSEQIKIFWDAIMAGDGHGTHYFTTSHRLADDMQEIGLKLGFSPRISSRQRKERIGLSFDINFRSSRDGWVAKKKSEKIKFDGTVYCLGIPIYHRFFLRQDGAVWLSGNSWVKKRWNIPDCPDGSVVMTYDSGTEHRLVFVPAKVTDNPTLMQNDPQYMKFLDGLPEDLRKAWRDGRWDIFAGQFFMEWDPRVHVVDDFKVPESWAKIRTIDPSGRNGNTACFWIAVDHDGSSWVYREHYGTGLDADQHAERIAYLSEGESYRYTVIDSAAFHKVGMPETMAEVYERSGVTGLVPASKNRVEGWDSVHRYLRHGEGMPPRLRVFRSCKNLIRTVPAMITDEKKVEDLAMWQEDDACDALRYGLHTFRDQSAVKPMSFTEKRLRDFQKSRIIKGIDSFHYRRR